MGKIYAAYGSNIHDTTIKSWAPNAREVGVGIIDGYKLLFRGGLATIEPKKDSKVPVKLYEISSSDEKGLDEYEGYAVKLYDKIDLPIQIKKYDEDYINRPMGDLNAMVYVMQKKYPYETPNIQYVRAILYGYLHTEEKYNTQIFTYEGLMKALLPF